jgi:glycosyltransferase involved in cell wall biosynthesis
MLNVEHVLRAQRLENEGTNPKTDSLWRSLRKQETQLHRFADGVFACSDDDRDLLRQSNHDSLRIATVPNGVACDKVPYHDDDQKHKSPNILFCGSCSYPPNIDGLRWFLADIWPGIAARSTHAKLQIVGRNFEANAFAGLLEDPSIQVIGEVDDVRPYYEGAGVAICPLRMGSGTRLKILEAMGYGNPVVSTSIGCEGIKAQDGKSIMIRDDATGFMNAVSELVNDGTMFDRLRKQARQLVQKEYDWEVVGCSTALTIQNWCAEKRQGGSDF